MFGLTPSQYQFIYESVIAPLESKGAIVWCFGSRARGTHKEFSDLDLMVEGPESLRAEIGQIREALSNSNFPYKVDLVLRSDFALSYVPQYESERIRFK